MKRLLNTKVLLVVIFFIAAFLRFYQLGSNPPSLTWDEASWGYNAYSLGIDGKDEFGRFLPLDYLESFGDFKPPMYAYLDIVPVKIFGLNEFGVRFPSAFFGALLVPLVYFLVKNIFPGSKNKEYYALATSFILAISPWHILLSRAAFEANVATFFISLGVLFFLLSINKNRWLLFLSITFFIFSAYTFNTARIAAPMLLAILALFFRRDLLEKKKESFLSLVLGLFLILPALSFLMSSNASLRFREVNIFSDGAVVENANRQIENDGNSLWSKLVHNRRFAYSVSYLKHYFDNLDPNFLFIKGDGNPKFSTQTVGQMYLWQIPFLIAGILYLIKKKEGYWRLVPLWLILGIIPAGVARETPHALRIENSLLSFQILTAYGLVLVCKEILKIRYQLSTLQIKYLILSGFGLILIFNFLYFYHDYFAHYPRIYSGEWQYGYKEAIDFVNKNQDKYSNIEVTTELGRPYIYYLFYSKTDPNIFRKKSKVQREALGFVNVTSFEKVRFTKNLDLNKKNTLFIDIPSSIPENAKILKAFYLLNGNPSLIAFTL